MYIRGLNLKNNISLVLTFFNNICWKCSSNFRKEELCSRILRNDIRVLLTAIELYRCYILSLARIVIRRYLAPIIQIKAEIMMCT